VLSTNHIITDCSNFAVAEPHCCAVGAYLGQLSRLMWECDFWRQLNLSLTIQTGPAALMDSMNDDHDDENDDDGTKCSDALDLKCDQF
jgi:hypothetical protein